MNIYYTPIQHTFKTIKFLKHLKQTKPINLKKYKNTITNIKTQI
ncbi:hypothetical protein C548_261 [Candidatus Portiera aleyrodidarum BT-QVLC]|nr:hypothetical protein C548_261 [Candidatus Portiera aleyrodidarum BT-QVLC]